jgi:ferrous iron transport protein A
MKMTDLPSALLETPSPDAALDASSRAVSLADLAVGEYATIHAVLPTDRASDAELLMRLIEIGFVPGERVRVIAAGHPGREPLAVRLAATDSGRRGMNGATFALRRYEAALIRVVPDVQRA